MMEVRAYLSRTPSRDRFKHIGVFSALSSVLPVLATVIHEFGHLFVGEFVYGLSVARFDPLSGVTFAEPFPSDAVRQAIGFAGGYFSATVVFLSFLVLSRIRAGGARWWLWIPFLFAVMLELVIGTAESFFYSTYVALMGGPETGLEFSALFAVVAMAAAFAIYGLFRLRSFVPGSPTSPA